MRRFLLVSFLLVCSLWVPVLAQDRTVTGKVTSAEDGSAIPGVSVILKGTNRGTNTDALGSYVLSVPAQGGTLIVSFVGTTSQEIGIGNRSAIDVKLVSDSRQLTEVVVTGVGVATDKRKLGIAVEAVSAKNLPQTPTASVDQALVGKIAGAQITSSNGTPGAPVNIVLRGINTINRGTQPIILIDGVQVDATTYDPNGNTNPLAILNAIDLNNIERVEVVQGAAAATLYGAQGANGVIQLFTKKGQAGKLNINFSSGIAQNTFLNVGGVRKAALHGYNTDAQNNVIGSNGNPLQFDTETGTYDQNLLWLSTDPATQTNKPYNANLKYYDHYGYFFQPAYTYNNSLSLSGGRDKFDFSITATNNQQTSNIINNGGYNRSNFSVNLGAELAKGLTFRSSTQLVYTKSTIKSGDRNIFYSLNNARPFADFGFAFPNGSPAIYFGDAVGVNHLNPGFYQNYTNVKDNKVDVIQNFNLNYKVNRFLDLDAKYGINFARQEIINILGNQASNPNVQSTETFLSSFATDDRGEISNYSLNTTYQNFIGSAFINTDFQNDFKLNVPIRTSTQIAFDYRNRLFRRYTTYGLGLPDYTPFTAAQAGTQRINEDYSEPFITYGYLVNQRIDFGDVAGVSGGFRTDYSSAFGQASKPFTFPRGDAYFRLSALKFYENSALANFLPELKFRAAYGEAGIQPKPFDRYVTLGTRTLGTTNVFYSTLDQSNPDLNVEVSRELEIGTDLALTLSKSSNWLSSLRLSGTYWKRSTDNAIYRVNAAPSSGVATLLDNAFSLASNGFQASLNATLLRTQNFTWNLTTNFGKQSSKITNISGGQEIVVTSSAGSSNYVLKAGEKIGQLYGFVGLHDVNAIDPNTGQPFIAEAQRSNYEVASNGWVVNKTTKAPYFSANQYSFGDPNPKFTMSFISDFTFKNFLTFGFQFDWVNGSHVYNQTKEWMYRDGIHADYENPITINGQTGAWSAFYRGVYAERSRNGTKNYFYEDASFVRLRNVQLGVDLSKLINTPVLRRAQIVLSGRNLLTFTKYTGFDPEVSSGASNSSFDRGVDHNTVPNTRAYQATLNIGF